MSRIVSDGAAAGATSRFTTVRQPMPMRPCRGAPVSIATAIGTSVASSAANRSANAATLAERAGVEVIAADVATTSANSTESVSP